MKIGSFCSGYGGLDMAIEKLFDAKTSWVSDVEPSANKVLAKRFPDSPNLGDIKLIDWSSVEPVDIFVGGYPCQGFSQAGKRTGKEHPQYLWPWIVDALKALRPQKVCFENVRGHLSLGFGEVLTDLDRLGYVTDWAIVTASSVGAAHERARLFIYGTLGEDVATPKKPIAVVKNGRIPPSGRVIEGKMYELPKYENPKRGKLFATATAGMFNYEEDVDQFRARMKRRKAEGRDIFSEPLGMQVRTLPTLRVHNNENRQSEGYGPNLGESIRRLRTVQSNDAKSSFGENRKYGQQINLTHQVARLPTLLSRDHRHPSPAEFSRNTPPLGVLAYRTEWGEFESAIRVAEGVMGRTAPSPVEGDPNTGKPRLSVEFCEWFMMLPEGHVSELRVNHRKLGDNEISRSQAIAMLGNGVVPPQAYEAYRFILERRKNDHQTQE